jgi:hypothetical protein
VSEKKLYAQIFLLIYVLFIWHAIFFHGMMIHGPGQDRKQLLREWVLKNGDAAAIEAAIVVSRSTSSKLGTQRELLTVAEMVSKGYPPEKISAIVAKGGIPDPDVPHIPSLFKYWCQTSCVMNDVEEVKQESQVTVQAQPSAAAVGALMSGPEGPATRCALPTGCLEQMMQAAQPPGQRFSMLHFFYAFHQMHLHKVCLTTSGLSLESESFLLVILFGCCCSLQ